MADSAMIPACLGFESPAQTADKTDRYVRVQPGQSPRGFECAKRLAMGRSHFTDYRFEDCNDRPDDHQYVH